MEYIQNIDQLIYNCTIAYPISVLIIIIHIQEIAIGQPCSRADAKILIINVRVLHSKFEIKQLSIFTESGQWSNLTSVADCRTNYI